MRLINATQLVNELKWCEVCNLSIEEIINIINKQPSAYYPAVIDMKPLSAEDKNTLMKALKKNGLNTIALYAEPDYPKKPQGTWVYKEYDYTCSICGKAALESEDYPFLSSYCPFCGAEMEIEQ